MENSLAWWDDAVGQDLALIVAFAGFKVNQGQEVFLAAPLSGWKRAVVSVPKAMPLPCWAVILYNG